MADFIHRDLVRVLVGLQPRHARLERVEGSRSHPDDRGGVGRGSEQAQVGQLSAAVFTGVRVGVDLGKGEPACVRLGDLVRVDGRANEELLVDQLLDHPAVGLLPVAERVDLQLDQVAVGIGVCGLEVGFA